MQTYSRPWKAEIYNIAQAFHISSITYRTIIAAVDKLSTDNMPAYYNGDENAYLYDAAYRKIKKFIFA